LVAPDQSGGPDGTGTPRSYSMARGSPPPGVSVAGPCGSPSTNAASTVLPSRLRIVPLPLALPSTYSPSCTFPAKRPATVTNLPWPCRLLARHPPWYRLPLA